MKYQVWSLEVWGNREDGYEISDRSDDGFVEIPRKILDDDLSLLRLLEDDGVIDVENTEDWDFSGDDVAIILSYQGKPIIMLERD